MKMGDVSPVSYKGRPRKVYMTVNVKAGSDNVLSVLQSPERGKRWQMFMMEAGAEPKVGIYNFRVNGENLGLFVQGTDSTGTYGNFNVQERYGPQGIMISSKDVISVDVSNTDNKDILIGLSICCIEYDV